MSQSTILKVIYFPPFLYEDQKPSWDFPYICLVVSGGHTHLFYVKALGDYYLLGQTLDDAAGEAFDKFARLMNFPYASGVYVDQNSKDGDKNQFSFPLALKQKGNLNFSFSGLKTSAYRLIEKVDKNKNTSSLCASFQEAIVQQLLFKIKECLEKHPIKNVAVVGGVSANSRLREVFREESSITHLSIPPLQYCTDNASMIGYASIQRYIRGQTPTESHKPSAHHLPNDFKEWSSF